MRKLCRTLTVSILAAVLTAGTLTFADADARSISYDLNIPSEDLTASLQSFAIASHHKLLYKAELTAGKISRALKGHFTAQEAMEALLSGTGLSYEITGSSVVLIKDQTGAKTSELREEGTPYSPPAPSQSRGRHPILLAQVDQGKTASDVPVDKSDDQARKKKTKSLEEIVVTGSRLSEKAKDTAQPVNIYTRQAIDQTGVTSVADFLNTLPDASTASAGTVNTFAGGQSVQLHGLPSGTTLVLVNGRRIGASGTQAFGDVFDLNNIPLAAVDRIEVVPTGSSAVYGSDAIAGVVNIILKKDIEGVAVDARYGGAIGTRDSAISASAGHRWDAFDASVILSFDRKDELLGSDRAITKSSNYTPFGGPDNDTDYCAPSNIYGLGGAALPGLGAATYAATPPGLTAPATIGNYASTAGTLNRCGVYRYSAVVPSTDRAGAVAQATYRATPTTELFAELWYTHMKREDDEGPPLLYGTPAFQSYSVSALNRYNPFGVNVGLSERLSGVTSGDTFTTDLYRPLLGMRGRLGSTWSWEVTGSYAHERTGELATNMENSIALQSALNSSNPKTALDPFTDGPQGSPQLLDSLLTNQLTTYGSATSLIDAVTRGQVITLPAGPITAALGAEGTRESITFEPSYTTLDESRRSYAAFGEVRVPILSRGQSEDTGNQDEILVVGSAVRYDHYSDFGGKASPQFSAELRPLKSLLFRGAYGESFKAPALAQLYESPFTTSGVPVFDPVLNRTEPVTTITGGNASLKPTTGHSTTFGVVYSDPDHPDLRVSATNWLVRETNSVNSLLPQTIVTYEGLFPGHVARADGPGTPITTVFDNYVNYGTIDVAGIDYGIHYTRQLGPGVLVASADATQTYRYSVAFIPGTPSTDRVSQANDDGNWAPRWKLVTGLTWSEGVVSTHIAGRYVGTYRDYDPLPSGNYLTLGDFWLFDANIRASVGDALGGRAGWAKGMYLEIGATNLLNRGPQFSYYSFGNGGYDPLQFDIQGRTVYGRIGGKW